MTSRLDSEASRSCVFINVAKSYMLTELCRYLKKGGDGDVLSDDYKWWHKKLADYFCYSDNYDRKAEVK